MQKVDWSIPQRQPVEGLVIVVLKTVWEVVKRVWPLLLLMVFRQQPEEGQDRSDFYEWLVTGVSVLALLAGVFRFFYFRFYILNNELVVKKGWIKKETLTIPLQKIQTVHIEQSLLHEVLQIVKLSIDTAGSTKTEVTIDALRRPMAEALRYQLLEGAPEGTEEHAVEAPGAPLFRLTGKDLFRLSVSANHLEAFFLLLSFGLGILENLRTINDNAFSDAEGIVRAGNALLYLYFIPVLLITIFLISTARILFKYYNFTVFGSTAGYRIKSGLTNVKERTVAFSKIQYVSWKASWIRKLMKLWILEYHISGSDEQKRAQKVHVPVTSEENVPVLVHNYYPLPDPAGREAVRIHPAFIYRRLLFRGLFPTAVLMGIFWPQWGTGALVFLGYAALVALHTLLYQRKFRLWSFDEEVLLRKGFLGEGFVLLQWYKVQSVVLRQSLYERRRGLASLVLHTASGRIRVPFIPLDTAQALMNYALYQVERAKRAWM
ncbi:MAG TPA: PH domain-containing protein [Chitinophagaceae bacterium]